MPAQQSRPPDDDVRQKSTLFCPTCGHESDVTGDWVETVEDDRRRYACPVCSTTITDGSQPRPTPDC